MAIAGHTSTLGSSHALLSAVSTSQALLLLPNSPPTPHDISPLPHFSLARWILLMFGIAEICAPPPMTASLSGDELGVALQRADAMLSNWSNTVFVKCPFRSDLRKCLGWPVDQAHEDCGSRLLFCQKSTHFVPSWGNLRKNTWFLSPPRKFQDSKESGLPTKDFHLNMGRVLLSNHVHEVTRNSGLFYLVNYRRKLPLKTLRCTAL